MKKMNQQFKKLTSFLQRNKGSLFILLCVLVISACSPNDNNNTPNVLTVTTNTPSNITDTTATLGGNVTKDGGKTVTSKGICIGINANPTIDDANDIAVVMGNGLGSFSDDFYPFEPSTTYHVRAYATNADGTVYGEDKSFTTQAATACNVINVTTDITIPTTWMAGNVYVISSSINDLLVSSTLTIQPGTVIKLNGGLIDVTGSGKIIANGTSNSRIVFTSFADDSHCGDTNGDGTSTVPAKGDWKQIWLNGGTGMSFTYCDFFYAGQVRGGEHSVIEIGPSNVSTTFDNCHFAHTLGGSNSNGDVAFNASFDYMKSVPTFTNNAFYDNDKPIYLYARYSLNTNNIFHDPNNASITNARNGIFLASSNIPAGTTTNWNITEVPYVAGIQLQALNGSTLNIGANVKVKFVQSSDYLGAYSSSVNLNPAAILTSYKDDAVGGDTNGDGSASSPATGDWKGYSNTVPGTTTWIRGTNIKYATN